MLLPQAWRTLDARLTQIAFASVSRASALASTLDRYIREYAARYNMRSLGALECLWVMAKGMEDKWLWCSNLATQ